MQNPAEFLKNAASRLRHLAATAPEIADRLNTLAGELDAEARAIEAGPQNAAKTGADDPIR